jgi:hypothetical protein
MMNIFGRNSNKSVASLRAELPGPDRKRQPTGYHYLLHYRARDPEQIGCVMLWEVSGGRTAYQIAIQRDEAGHIHSHCTCGDAVFRSHVEGHVCKHVRGFLQLGRRSVLPEGDAPLQACA